MIHFFVKKFIGKSVFYDFICWLYDQYLVDCKQRYEPHMFRFFGEGVTIGHKVIINRPDRVVLKKHAVISHGAIINSKGGLYVGKYSGIGYNCVILTSEHHYRKAGAIPFDNGSDLKPVIIRDFVWIGSHVKITPGREIGEGAIVGIGSVVSKDVPPLAIVMGNPARIVGYRDKDHFEKCKDEEKFQSPVVGGYREKLFPLYRRRFKKEIEELGISDL